MHLIRVNILKLLLVLWCGLALRCSYCLLREFIIPRCYSCWDFLFMASTPGVGATALVQLVSQVH